MTTIPARGTLAAGTIGVMPVKVLANQAGRNAIAGNQIALPRLVVSRKDACYCGRDATRSSSVTSTTPPSSSR